ncbi:hypothetical protein, partial [Acidovorax sp. sic0104]|uniref:hypothetical protein n=1 Tax=Acidovorax sp. sic0104 TaxID=2854784 RepID=UPI001C445677
MVTALEYSQAVAAHTAGNNIEWGSWICVIQSKTPFYSREQKGGLGCKSLTMTYFHTGTRTIIG